jgi:hypothetical protein
MRTRPATPTIQRVGTHTRTDTDDGRGLAPTHLCSSSTPDVSNTQPQSSAGHKNMPDEESQPLVQLLHEVEPTVEYGVSAGQTAHVAAPAVVPRVPAGHGKQAAAEVAPAERKYVPAGHRVQVVAPSASENDPAGHCVQLPPGVSITEPARHRTHAVTPGNASQALYPDQTARCGYVTTTPLPGSSTRTAASATMMVAVYGTPAADNGVYTSVPQRVAKLLFITTRLEAVLYRGTKQKAATGRASHPPRNPSITPQKGNTTRHNVQPLQDVDLQPILHPQLQPQPPSHPLQQHRHREQDTHRMVKWNKMSVPGPNKFRVPVRVVSVVTPQLARMHDPGQRTHSHTQKTLGHAVLLVSCTSICLQGARWASGRAGRRVNQSSPGASTSNSPHQRHSCHAGEKKTTRAHTCKPPRQHPTNCCTCAPDVATQLLELQEHAKHADDPNDAVNIFAGQGEHVEERAAAKLPAAQDTQEADPELAAVPAAHTEHTTAPADDAVPPGHTTASAEPPAQVKPAGHTVPLIPAEPTGQYAPGGAVHGLHTDAAPPAKLPAGHTTRPALPPAQAEPMGHGVPEGTVLPAGQ